ncbi:MAG: PIN domain-containing protein [Vicinamibacterales bacterium]
MIAVDTNVLIYACDRADPRRQQIALDLVTNAEDGVLLWQVACEFISASRKLSKQGFTSTHAWNRLAEFRALLPLVLPSEAMLARAKELHLTRGASFWDALVLAACVDAAVKLAPRRPRSRNVFRRPCPGLQSTSSRRQKSP